ncbi:MAG: hypothetical protein CMM93_06965 [Rickettsiales bacterium]|nr:hypothetical protein [Rickettsiales bacterium]|tara:strand:- start:1967 stop:2395 length:429 start_codon:yes stop_codon:yes gene_type:complete
MNKAKTIEDPSEEVKIVIIKEEDRISLDRASTYEISKAISERIAMINETGELFSDNANLAKLDQLEGGSYNIKESDIIEIKGAKYIKLTSSRDLAKKEINEKKSPFTLLRIISQDKKLFYVEVINLNDLPVPQLDCYSSFRV